MRLSGLKRISLAAISLVLTASVALSAAEGTDPSEPGKLSPGKLTGMLEFSPRTVYYGGCMISGPQPAEGPVVVIAGTLDIQDGGVLEGDAWIVNGRLIMTGSSRVNGDVYMVNSSDFLSRDAVISGDIEYYECECRLDDKLFEGEGGVAFVRYEDPKGVKTKFIIGGDKAGRADYSPIGFGFKRENKKHRDPYVYVKMWTSISIFDKTTGLMSFDADFAVPLGGRRLELVLHAFKRTFTNDSWMLSDRENGVILMLTGDDFFDYWERRGGEVGMRYKAKESLTFECLLSYQEDVSLAAKAVPSLLFPRDKYRENPPVDQGERIAATGRILLDTRIDEIWRENAWQIGIWVEKGIADGPGDFSYMAFDIDAKRYNYLPWRSRLDMRAKLFSSFDAIPAQITRSLNGYGGVRGTSDFPFAVQRGDRLALFSIEFRRELPDIRFVKSLFSTWNLLIFSDIGLLASADNKKSPLGFLDAPFEDWKKTAGIGISGQSLLPYIGFYVAQDLDSDKFEPRYILRVERSF